jgi:cyclopropane fatty-acyl-phospholipid synthase-like methyltransferase
MKQDTSSMQADPPVRNVLRDQITVLNIAEGFFQSSVLFALLKLGIFEHIGEGEKHVDHLAAELDIKPQTLRRVLSGGVVFKLLESADGIHFRLSPASRSVLLTSAGDDYLGNWIANLDFFRTIISGLDQSVLKSGPSVDPKAYVDDEHTREFALAMHNYAVRRGKELARFLDCGGCKSILDLGCGPGTYVFQLGVANPEAELYLLDLPNMLAVAREVQQRFPLKNKVHYVPGDVGDPIPGSYDLILASNMLHMLGEKGARTLIEKLYDRINPGGSLVIQAQFLRDDCLGERWPVLIDLMQLCMTVDGRNHTVRETKQWLESAGFVNVEFCSMSMMNTNSFVRGYKL